MATYYETKAILDEIAARTTANAKKLEQARALVAAATADLVSMPSAYSGFGSQLDTDAAANSESEAWQLALNEKNLLAAEFVTLRNTAQTLNSAVGN